MELRPTQSSNFSLVAEGIRRNLLALVRAQEQVSTGKRILRPSDDGIGTALSMSLSRQLAGVDSNLSTVQSLQPVLASSTSGLEEGSNLLSEARAVVLQGLNGTLSKDNRLTLADQLDQIADGLLDVANSRFGDRYLFGGTENSKPPFVADQSHSEGYVRYQGDYSQQRVQVGQGTTIEVNLHGEDVFGGSDFSGVGFNGITGLSEGVSGSSGAGFMNLTLRTDSVTGGNVAGLNVTATGDTSILGQHTLNIDAANRTVSLGSGAEVVIPDPLPSDFEVRDADGSVAVVDFTGWTGAFVTATLVGAGSISSDGVNFDPLDLAEDNLALRDEASGNVMYLDATMVTRAGNELVAFKGATNVFDALRGLASDMRNSENVPDDTFRANVEVRFQELLDGQERLLTSLGKLGVRNERLNSTEQRLETLSLQLTDMRANITDVDLASAVLELQQAEQTLQLTQATGARLMQQSLLNYLN